ncbi:LytR/AlgR family response regulator transcription factor [Anaerocolumna sp. MB42-C2]|uniref:LytR/AlgR family response regulator transcription factor n=1 Tax=Anaerocolumna sp. MB42-C2 TaxID=3070997 RepID=UPI0027DFB02D|nr:LytTR family DNA-binding domain-containing protein [Anaerocolumna sp. MB42-C2]WMJ88128.1 LytTR family DNA-binding domain-containing protein [Anaerocolumna sp. MB42-C2]
MLRIAICDDENRARDMLRFSLEKILEENKEEVVYEFSSGAGAVRWLKQHPGEIDLLFLDVEMEGISGIETARQIRKFDQNLKIVFVTGYPDFVFDGYRVQALDYLLKPTNLVRLSEVLHLVRKLVCDSYNEQFTFQNADGTYRLYLKDILYCFSDRRKVFVVTRNKTLSLYAKLEEVQNQLGAEFIRIHQRFLVNAAAVEQINNKLVVVDGQELPLSRSLKAQASSKLAKAMLGDKRL